MDRRRHVGMAGERIAEWFLTARGAKVLGRNLAVGGGEIDLVVAAAGVPTAVEVRSSTGTLEFGILFPATKLTQVRRLARTAGCRRVDLVAVGFSRDAVTVRWFPDVR
ncbi:MAG TPA: YraN family protein [Acidimicrobiia bacterium]